MVCLDIVLYMYDLAFFSWYMCCNDHHVEREMCPWAISISILVIRCPTHKLSTYVREVKIRDKGMFLDLVNCFMY
jgi:hypothetical protein